MRRGMGTVRRIAMKKARIVNLILSILICFILTGCGSLLEDEQMDRQVESAESWMTSEQL